MVDAYKKTHAHTHQLGSSKDATKPSLVSLHSYTILNPPTAPHLSPIAIQGTWNSDLGRGKMCLPDSRFCWRWSPTSEDISPSRVGIGPAQRNQNVGTEVPRIGFETITNPFVRRHTSRIFGYIPLQQRQHMFHHAPRSRFNHLTPGCQKRRRDTHIFPNLFRSGHGEKR